MYTSMCIFREMYIFEFLESHYTTPRKYLKQLENIQLCGCGKGVIDLAQKSVISLNNQLIVEWLRVSLMHSCCTSRACLTKYYTPARNRHTKVKNVSPIISRAIYTILLWYQIIQHARGWLIRVVISARCCCRDIVYPEKKKREIIIKIYYVCRRMTRNDFYDGVVSCKPRVVNEIIPKQDV